MSGSPASRPRLLFVDHEFHRKTRSFEFLYKLVEPEFDVRIVYVDPELPVRREELLDDSEYVLICQLDFLTPLFVAAGKRVVVVQMYDGSSGLPDAHWAFNRQAHYLNFSVTLHARALASGATSKLVRFFPDPARFSPVEDFKDCRVFFWQRLPRSPINLASVQRLLGHQISSLHVHTPTDDGSPFDPASLAQFSGAVTTSSWFRHRDDFLTVLERSNVYVAPRPAEGIGHGFLEALARGMVVLAYDSPTHNEYIANGVNGILFNGDSGHVEIPADQRRAIGLAARTTIECGHRDWLREQLSIAPFIRSTPRSMVPPGISVDHEINRILAAYQEGLGPYTRQLRDSRALVAVMGHWHDLLHEEEAAEQALDHLVEHAHDGPWHADRVDVFPGSGYPPEVKFEGWSEPEWSHRWAVQREASISIPLKDAATLYAIEYEMRALRATPLTIAINGTQVGRVDVDPNFVRNRLVLEQPLAIAAGERLQITLRSELPFYRRMPRVEVRPLTFCVKALGMQFSP